MLDADMTEKEQIEALGRWWHHYGKNILYAVIIGLFFGFGWRYWQNVRVQYLENASMHYHQLLSADKEKDYTTVKSTAALLKEKFSKTPYASMGALIAAKEAVDANQF